MYSMLLFILLYSFLQLRICDMRSEPSQVPDLAAILLQYLQQKADVEEIRHHEGASGSLRVNLPLRVVH